MLGAQPCAPTFPLRYTDPSGHAAICGVVGESCEGPFKATLVSPESKIAEIDRLRRRVTGPIFGQLNVIDNMMYILYWSSQYRVDPSLVAAIIYYESDAIERIGLNITGYPWMDADLWKYVLTGEASIGVGQVRVDTAMKLETKNLVIPYTPNVLLIGRRGAIALRLSVDPANIQYIAANISDIQTTVHRYAADLNLTTEQQRVLIINSYNVGKENIEKALIEAQQGSPQALSDYLAWPYAHRGIFPIYYSFRSNAP